MDREEYERKRKAYLAMKRRNRKIRRIAVLATGILVLVCLIMLIKSMFGKNNSGTGDNSPTGVSQVTPGGKKQKGTDTPSPSPSSSPTPTPSPTPNVVSLVAVGDNLYDWDMLEDGYNRETKTFDFSGNYDNIAPYAKMADFAVINQETPLGGDGGYNSSGTEVDYIKERNRWGSYHGYATFNTPDEVAIEFMKAGFNVVTCATNHTSDYGIEAVHATLNFWKKYPQITVLGIHDSQASQDTITVVEKYGIRIAMLNYTYGLNIDTAIKAEPYSVDLLTEAKVKRDVELAKKMSDFVVVFPHWGNEYSLSVSAYQKDWTKRFADYGVDVVIGAHPHICEPMEIVDRADGGKMAVYYSLGNFLSMFKTANCELEGMAYVEFYKDGDTKYVKEATIIPLVNHFSYDGSRFRSRYNFTVYALQDYTEELANAHGCLVGFGNGDGKGFSLQRMQQLAEQLWAGHIKTIDWNSINGMSTR